MTQFDDELLQRIKSVVQPGDEIPTVSNKRPNVLAAIDSDGIWVQTLRSESRSGPQLVPAWMITTAWQHLQKTGTLTHTQLLEDLNVKRSAFVIALLAQFPEVQLRSTRPIVIGLVEMDEEPRKFPSTARLPTQNNAMNAHEYRDDDDGYRDWLKKHPGGYVINIPRSHSPVDAFVHDAGCSALIAQLDRDVSLTGPYVKVCGVALPAVEKWAADNVDGPVEPCGKCRGGGGIVGPDQTTRMCPTCRLYELSVTGKCPSCDDD